MKESMKGVQSFPIPPGEPRPFFSGGVVRVVDPHVYEYSVTFASGETYVLRVPASPENKRPPAHEVAARLRMFAYMTEAYG